MLADDTRTHTHSLSVFHTHTHIKIYTYARTHKHTHTNTHTHTRTHTHSLSFTHTHIHTHTHSHAQRGVIRPRSNMLPDGCCYLSAPSCSQFESHGKYPSMLPVRKFVFLIQHYLYPSYFPHLASEVGVKISITIQKSYPCRRRMHTMYTHTHL